MAGFHYRIAKGVEEVASSNEFHLETMARLGLSHLCGLRIGINCWLYAEAGGCFLTTSRDLTGSNNICLTWHEVSNDVSIGWEPRRIPIPEDLRKTNGLQRCLKLADIAGRSWDLPVIRENVPGCSLPRVISFQKGVIVRPLMPKFRHIADLAESLADRVENQELNEFQWFEILIEILRVNYRLSPIEIEAFNAMNVLLFRTSDCLTGVVLALGLQSSEVAK